MQNVLKKALLQDKNIINSRNKAKSILLDLIPNESKKINLLITCIDSGIVKDMQKYSNQKVNNYITNKWIDKLTTEWGLQESNAIWALKEWAEALNVKLPNKTFPKNSTKSNTRSLNKNKTKKKNFKQTIIGIIISKSLKGFIWIIQIFLSSIKEIFLFVFSRLKDNLLYSIRRLIAAIIDFIIIDFFSIILSIALELPKNFHIIIFLLIFIIYFTKMESSNKNATWGKRMLGLTVFTNSGYSLNFFRAFGRTILKLITIPSIVGILTILFSKNRKAIHDILTATEVYVE